MDDLLLKLSIADKPQFTEISPELRSERKIDPGGSGTVFKESWKNTELFTEKSKILLSDLQSERKIQVGSGSLGSVFEKSRNATEIFAEISPSELQLERKIGSGGFGTVFKGSWNKTEVAIKVFKLEGNIKPRQAAIQKEAETWAKLRHPRVLQFLGADTMSEIPFIVMPYLENGNARDFIERTPECNRNKILYDVTLALIYLHGRNVVHGDIKGFNVLIDGTRNAVLCDFGITLIKDDVLRTSYSGERWISGTPSSMPPERLKGGSLRKPCDVYAFGMLIYEVHANANPLNLHVGFSEFVKLVAIEGYRPERPDRDEAPQMTDDIWGLAQRCWEGTASARPTINEVCDIIAPSVKLYNNYLADTVPRDGGPERSDRDEAPQMADDIKRPAEPTPAAMPRGLPPKLRIDCNNLPPHPATNRAPSGVPVALPRPQVSRARAQRSGVRGSTLADMRDHTWALRPPPENVYERLEEFFPNHDLDKPVIEASSGGISPTTADHPTVIPPPPVNDKSRSRGKKSIRIVAEEHKKRIDRTSRADASISNVLRKRSTKLWGSRLEEVTPAQGKAAHTTSLPDSPGGPKPIFKWVRGELIRKATYGRVYLALNATTGEMIAVKQVEIPRTASDKNDTRQDTVFQAFKMENETLKDLDHPNIVQYLGFEETPYFLNIFFEYVPGGSIGSCLQKHGAFNEDVTKSFMSHILSGLEYLHSKGVLHGDLKTDNILLETSGICKISDVGVSKQTDDVSEPAFTAMHWMVPEVIDTRQNFKIDIWSIGCVVLEMWAGSRPWLGDEDITVMFKRYHPPPVPGGLQLSPLADNFRLECFDINPEERPTAAQLRRHPYLVLPPGWVFSGFK